MRFATVDTGINQYSVEVDTNIKVGDFVRFSDINNYGRPCKRTGQVVKIRVKNSSVSGFELAEKIDSPIV